MTSKHLFFKAMKEDICHKLWMVALSVLGNFLVLTVGWMVWKSNSLSFWGGAKGLMQLGDARRIAEFQGEIVGFFGAYLVIAGGIIAAIGAIITGLFSFRYLFHKNMVDTCHSLPVKRDTLYGVKYANGILIWFVPFLVSLILTFVMGCSLLRQVEGEAMIPDMAADTVFTLLILVVAYLLVYHLVLVAVMLSGNMLNTLVSMMILGFSVVGFYGLGLAYFDGYFGTFYMPSVDLAAASYGSPFFSVPFLLVLRMDEESLWEIWKGILVNAGMMALLGGGAWLLYRNRPSEAAEQGIWNKATAFLFRLLVGVAAGMCGWGFFVMLVSDSRALAWGIFGAVLVGICAFGVLDIVFQMDFKAFFAHRLQMAGTVAASLLVCFTFYWDWFGYDTRLPELDEIAELALYDNNLASNYHYYRMTDMELFGSMHYQDKEAIYAFLERMVEHEREDGYWGEQDRVGVKVTLNSGRSYYRYYWMQEEDKELAWPILTSEDYLKSAYMIDIALLDSNTDFSLSMDGREYHQYEITPQSRSIADTYNQEILEEPDKALLKEGKLVAEMIFRTDYKPANGAPRWVEGSMEVYDSMERTLAALQAAGFTLPDAEELGIHCFVLNLECSEDAMPEERVALAREMYGVPGQADEADMTGGQSGDLDAERWEKPEGSGQESAEMTEPEESEETGWEQGQETTNIYDMNVILQGTYSVDKPVKTTSLQITDKEEIEELFKLLSFNKYFYTNSVFGKDYINVMSIMEDGSVKDWYLPKGTLPEKYVLRFGKARE